MRRHARLAGILYATAAVAYAADRVSKVWAEGSLQDRGPVEVVPGIWHLTYTTNSGGAFGIGSSAPLLFVGATLLVVGIIVWSSFRLPRPLVAVGLGLVLGGALGNLTDRVVRGEGWAFDGSVVDFLDLRVWPVFNLADTAIMIGAAVLALAAFDRSREDPAQRPGAGVGDER